MTAAILAAFALILITHALTVRAEGRKWRRALAEHVASAERDLAADLNRRALDALGRSANR